jgi:hypothetical protein
MDRIALMKRYLSLGDSTVAHRDAVALLADTNATSRDAGRSLMLQLIAFGEADRLEAWARAAPPAERSRRLIAVAETYFLQVGTRLNRPYPFAYFSADECRMPFER